MLTVPPSCDTMMIPYGFLAVVKMCHADDYRTIQIIFAVITCILLLVAIANFILLGVTTGWKNWTRNVRVKVHFVNAALLVVGLALFVVHCQNLWNFQLGTRRWFSSFGFMISGYIVYTVIVITLVHWYMIMLALQASVEHRTIPNHSKCRVPWIISGLWAGFALVVLGLALGISLNSKHSSYKTRSAMVRITALALSALTLLFTVGLGGRVVMLFRRLQKQRNWIIAGSSGVSNDEHAKIFERQSKAVLTMVLMLTFMLVFTVVESIVMLIITYDADKNLYWNDVYPRLCIDTTIVLLYYIVMLVFYRFNRDSPVTSELWNAMLSSVRDRLSNGTTEPAPQPQDVDVVADGTVLVTTAAEVDKPPTKKDGVVDRPFPSVSITTVDA